MASKGRFRVVWSATARRQLLEAVAYIAIDDRQAALRLRDAIVRHVRQLQANPLSGRVVPEFQDPQWRELITPPYRLVYRVLSAERKVAILSVWHGARAMVNPR